MPKLNAEILEKLKEAVALTQAVTPPPSEKGRRLDWASMMSARFPFIAYENTLVYQGDIFHEVRTSEIEVLGLDVNPDDEYSTGPKGKFKDQDGNTFRGDPTFYYPTREDAVKDANIEYVHLKKTQAQDFLERNLKDFLPELVDLAGKAFHDSPVSSSRARPGRG